jgi:aspartate aminotransferase-like enzyme
MDAAAHPALLLVDGVSSIGALEFKFDDWQVDVAVTGSQKALSLPTGLALVCASNKVGDLQALEQLLCMVRLLPVWAYQLLPAARQRDVIAASGA